MYPNEYNVAFWKKNRQNNVFLGTYYIKSLVLSKWHNFIGWMRRWRSWLKSSQCGIFQLRAFGKNWGICAVKKKLTAACQKARPSICIIHSNFLSVLSMWGKVRIANVIFLITYPTLNFQQKLGYLRSEEEANSSFRRLVRPFLS